MKMLDVWKNCISIKSHYMRRLILLYETVIMYVDIQYCQFFREQALFMNYKSNKFSVIETASDTLCLIEVMKLYSTIEATTYWSIEPLLVENGELGEFDQPLFGINNYDS